MVASKSKAQLKRIKTIVKKLPIFPFSLKFWIRMISFIDSSTAVFCKNAPRGGKNKQTSRPKKYHLTENCTTEHNNFKKF